MQEICAAELQARGEARLLEIGCGQGGRLQQAAEIGLTVLGVEARPVARQAARMRLPGTFIVSDPERLPPLVCDLVLLSGALECEDLPYALFHTLFGRGIINPYTRVLLECDTSQNSGNIYSTSALAALFRNLRFARCEISAEGTRLRCDASGSVFASFMKERYVPGTWNELTAYEHLPRYDYAARLVAGARVLDFGCGTGYGARRLAEVAAEVLAVDIDEAALGYASTCHARSNLCFQRNADLGASLDEAGFDLITCFEVIEHIEAAAQIELVANLSRLLKPQGVLLISTPNPDVTALYGDNPYHLHEMRLEEFRTLLQNYFGSIRIFAQNISATAFLQAESAEVETMLCEPGLFGTGARTAAYVAACARTTLPPLPSMAYPDMQSDFIAQFVDMLRGRNMQILEYWQRLQDTQQREQQMRLYEKEQAARHEALSMARAELSHALAAQEQLRAELSTTEAELSLALATQEQLRAELSTIKAELSLALAAQGRAQAQADQARHAQHLAHTEAERLRLRLEQIEQSTSWRVLRRMSPVLTMLRPVVRPGLRFAYRVYRRLHGRPPAPMPVAGPINPIWQKRNLELELRLEPVWNDVAGCYDLTCDLQGPAPRLEAWAASYEITPYYQGNRAARRILHIIADAAVGGDIRIMADLAKNLPRPYEHAILTAAPWPGGSHSGVAVHHVQAPDPAALAQVLDEVRPDMVHVHYLGLAGELWYQAVLAALRGRGLPAMQNVNAPVGPFVDPVFGAYVFVSEYALKYFGAEALASGAAVEVIHPGIDLSLFESQDSAPDAWNAIGMVYRLEHDKLKEDSIDLLIEVVKRRPRTRAYVVGGGSLLQSYLERTEQAGVRENFRFTGYVPDTSLPGWYEKFRIFVAPIWKEGFGQVAPFAMSKGCAVAGYDIGALAEICGSHETLGQELDETAGIIVDLLDDPERLREIGQQNRARARTLFGLEAMIARYAALYDEMLPAGDPANGKM